MDVTTLFRHERRRLGFLGCGVLFLVCSSSLAAGATTYYVSKDGSDSNPCWETQPCSTVRQGISKLAGGDTLIIKGGLYKEALDCSSSSGRDYCIPSGSGWGNPTTLKANPGDVVTLRPKSKRNVPAVVNVAAGSQYIVLEGLTIDARSALGQGVSIAAGVNHVRLLGCEVMNAPKTGILIANDASQFNEVIGCHLHDIGTSDRTDHGLDISSSNNLLDGNTIYNVSSHGISLSSTPGMTGNTVRNNQIHTCQFGIGVYGGEDNRIYNNLIYDERATGLRLRNDAGDLSDTAVYNNTFYGRGAGDVGIDNESASRPTMIRNNIVYNYSKDVNDASGSSIVQRNLTGTDPFFIDPSSGNFHLRAASAAVDAGLTLDMVTADHDGVIRPQGAAYDIGAFEFEMIPPTAGKTYFVATDGADSSPGTQSFPFRTIIKGINALGSGDTLMIRGGTYSETIRYDFPASGTSWSNLTRITGYPGETVILKPNAGSDIYRVMDQTQVAYGRQYLLWQNLVFDGSNVQYECLKIGDGFNHQRFLNCEFRYSPSMGILVPGEHSTFNEYIHCYIHDVGTSTQFQHGLYLEVSDQLVDGCVIDHAAGHGIHLYGSSGMDRIVVRNCTIRNCERGIGLYGGRGHLIYNNLVYNILGYAILMRNDQGDLGDVRIFNNTFYSTGDRLYNYTTSANLPGTQIRNNIACLVKFGIQDDTGRAAVSNNLTTDPMFTDVTGGDFRLQKGSPAIDAGSTLNEVQVDHDGVTRPQGPAYDEGAFEFLQSAESGRRPNAGSAGGERRSAWFARLGLAVGLLAFVLGLVTWIAIKKFQGEEVCSAGWPATEASTGPTVGH